MRPRLVPSASSILAFLLVAFPVLAVACSSDAAPEKECVADKEYYCRCADLSDGAKICNPDGSGYAACTHASIPCPGGEIPDEEGKPPRGTGIEECPGKEVELEAKDVVITGDTGKAKSAEKGTGACGDADGPEHVYAVTATADGKLQAKLQGLNDATLYVRSKDCGTGDQVACSEQAAAGQAETVTFDVADGKTYYLFVDSKGDGGKYTLTLSTPRCGDGQVSAGEACDDGDKVDDNGCSNDCKVQGDALALGACPGVAVHVWDTPVVFTGTTATMGKKYKSQNAACTSDGTSSPDRAYAVTAHKTGTMTVTTSETTFNNILYARTDCAVSPEIACAGVKTTAGTSINFPVTSGKTYYVIIDGDIAPLGGTFKMTLGIQ